MPVYRPQVSVSAIIALLFATSGAFAAPSGALNNLLHQIFLDHAFDAQFPAQVNWLDEGAAYTALEKSSDIADAKDIVRYITSSGQRQILVSARTLIPQGEKKPLNIEGYEFSTDKQRVLIFTNTKPVWRQHIRGDYWLFDLNAKALTKLVGNGDPSTM